MKLKSVIESVVVRSRASGAMEVQPRYRQKPLEKGAAPVGVFTLLQVAEEIERLLNEACK